MKEVPKTVLDDLIYFCSSCGCGPCREFRAGITSGVLSRSLAVALRFLSGELSGYSYPMDVRPQ